MKKIFYILIALLITPVLVSAKNGINTEFNQDKCILTVSGTQTGHDATVSLFNDQNNLIGFKTGEIKNNNYSVEFVLSYDTDKIINITVSNENGTNETSVNNININACELKEEHHDDEHPPVVKDKSYTVEDENGNIVSFMEETGHEFFLKIMDYVGLSDKDLEELEISRELYDAVFESIVNVTKEYGTLIAFYEIEIKDENAFNIFEGPFHIRIKITDEMKKYNTFKLIYVDTDNNFSTQEPINLTVNGEYLEGTLDHLSTYALVGSNIDTPSDVIIDDNKVNPKTGDNIITYVLILGISVLVITGGIIYLNKKKK